MSEATTPPGSTPDPTRRLEPIGARVVAVADSDTRLKWARTVALAIDAALPPGAMSPDVSLVSFLGGAVPTDRQLEENRFTESYQALDEIDFVAALRPSTQVIVALVVGSRLHRLVERIGRIDEAERPLVVTGYAGVVYEKHIEGLLWRTGADIVLCNSAADQATFRSVLDQLALPSDGLVRAGLGVVDRGALAPSEIVERIAAAPPPRTLTFAVQPDVPRGARERVYLLERLVSYARAHPDREVVVKLRSAPGEQTTHTERFHYQDVFDSRVVDRPPNVRFEYGLMSDVLDRTGVMATISSTAAMESLARGIPTAILTDLGVREGLGNHFFLASGLLASMDDLTADRLPVPSAAWLADNGLSEQDRLSCAATMIARRLTNIGSDRADRRRPVPWVDATRAPFAHADAWAKQPDAVESDGSDSLVKRGLRWTLPRALKPVRTASRRLDVWTRV